MSQDKFLRRRIEITMSIKLELERALRKGTLELDKANEIATEIADRLKKPEDVETLNLEFAKIIKDFKYLSKLSLKLEELKKKDLDTEIADLVEDLISKSSFDKAISLGSQVISVYIKNPDINLDDFRLELLKKEHALTTKKSTKMHKTTEQKKKEEPPKSDAKCPAPRIVYSGPVEEGQILQEGEVFAAPGQEEFHDPAEDIKAPEIDAAKLAEQKEKFKENTKKVANLFKESAGDVSGETGSKLKDAAINLLAKVQDKLGKKEDI